MVQPSRVRRFIVVVVVVVLLLTLILMTLSVALPTGHHSDGFDIGLNKEMMTRYYRSDDGALCPSPKAGSESPEVLCRATPVCTSHTDCADSKHNCCFNGCVRICQTLISEPPLALDWIEETQYIYNASDVDEPSQEINGFLPCSTTVRSIPSKIQGCPDGYECQIYETGNPVTGFPNKGICVTDQRFESNPSSDHRDPEGSLRGFSKSELIILPGGCLLTAKLYNELEDFLKGGHYVSCKCVVGSVNCKVGYNVSRLNRNT